MAAIPLDPWEKSLQDIESYVQQIRYYRARVIAAETDPGFSEFSRRNVQSVFALMARHSGGMLERACRDQLERADRLCDQTRDASHAAYEMAQNARWAV